MTDMRESDLTRGSVPGVLFSFALPYLLANVLQALYGGADLFVVGQYDDAASVSGVAIGSQVMQTVTGIILGLTAGITVLVGIAAGARNEREMAAVTGSSVWLFAIAGAALATIASQGISFLFAVWFLYRRGLGFPFSLHDIRLDSRRSRRIAAMGAPIALQDALINISFLLITVIVNGMGVVASASLGVVEKIIVFAMLPPVAVSSAVAAMTAQNYGAGLSDRVDRCLYAGICMALVFGASFCLYSQFFPETLVALFTREADVIGMGAEYLRGYSIDCIMVSFVFCFNAHFSGQGNSLFPMLHSMIATFLFRIPLSWAFSHIGTDPLVWMGYAPPLSTLVSLVICVSYFLYRRRRRIAASV